MNEAKLSCVMPWKAFYMDERDGVMSAMPCCANWINRDYGKIDTGVSLEELWNGAGAQLIRQILTDGREHEICVPDCPWLISGRFSEQALRVIPGPAAFEENQRLNNNEILERKLVLASRPMAIRIIPTLRCNIDCRMCYQDHDAELPLPPSFIGEVRQLGPYIYDYQLHGGEVLISPHFREWVSPEWFDVNPQMLLSLVTNATSIPKGNRDILDRIRINYITVSINAATRETYRHITGADLFDRVMENIVMLREIGRKHQKRPFEVYLSFVIMRSNYHEVPAFVELANRLDLPFRLLTVVGDRNRESIFNETQIIADVLVSVNQAGNLVKENSMQEWSRVRNSLEMELDRIRC